MHTAIQAVQMAGDGRAALAGAAAPPKRRLSDRIEQAFDQACEQGQAEVAACMLKGLDMVLLGQPQPWERRKAALVVMRACAARLEKLRATQLAGATARAPVPVG